jgi:O-antigen/teichoic acid export membrane protein
MKEKNILHRISSNLGWSVISEATGKGVFFVANIYLARILGVENFGLFTLAQTVTYYFWLAVDLGTTMYGIREIAKNKEHAQDIINPLLTLRITAGIIIFTLYSFSILFFLRMPLMNKLTFAGCALYLITYAFYTDWALKGLEKFKYISFGSLASATVFLAAIFAFVKGAHSVIAAAFAWSLAYFFSSASLLILLYKKFGIKYKPSFQFSLWLHHLRESIFFTISGSLMVLYQYIPVLLLSIFFTHYEVGLFAAPHKIITGIGSAGFLIPMAFYPVLSELYLKDRIKFHKTHRRFQGLMLLLGVPVAVAGSFFSTELVHLIFGIQYAQCVTAFRIIIWLVPLYFLRYTYGSVLFAMGFQRSHNFATLSGTLSVITVGLLLIPRLSIVGASVALIISEMVIIIAMASVFRIKNREY